MRTKAMRTRHVFDEDMVAHLWANQSQDGAHNARRTFYFIADTIYSYGSHFPIARHVGNANRYSTLSNPDGKIVFATVRDYSATTLKHKWIVYCASKNLKTFHVHEVRASDEAQHDANVANYQARVNDAMENFLRSRKADKKARYLGEAKTLVHEGNEYAKYFGSKHRVKLPNEGKLSAEIKLRNAECKAEREERRKAEQACKAEREKYRAELADQYKIALQEWIEGKRVNIPYEFRQLDGAAYLRYVNGKNHSATSCGNEMCVQTSKNALVPLEDAKRAFKFVQLIRVRGVDWRRNGETCPVGQFQIDAIDANGNIVAGCHRIAWTEIERFAQLMGWTENLFQTVA